MTVVDSSQRVRAASLEELREAGRLVVAVNGHTVFLLADGDDVHAVDNRCPHMGFPLHRGTVSDGILTCHWHHARFDLCTGGTFDQWADDLRRFPVEIDGDDVYVDVSPREDPLAHQRQRLYDGLRLDIPLVVAKAAIALAEADPSGEDVFASSLEFGTLRRGGGWFRGLTTLTCLMNLVPKLEGRERAAALYHGAADVASDSAGMPPRFPLDPLPGAESVSTERLGRWFRKFIDVRDAEGAERALVSAVRSGASPADLADMLFAAATDHRYLEGGHTLDFTNKALEALDLAGWDRAESVLTSLAPQLAFSERMEESNTWRNPVDLVALLGALGDGAPPAELASAVTYAAATRIARFPTSNEFGDWDTALHTFTFANAVEQGLRRSPSRELLRGVLDAAMSVHLDRFLNVPAVRLPEPKDGADIDELAALLDEQQRVNEAGQLVASYLGTGGDADRVVATLGACLLREDRNFHTIQCVEAAVRQHELTGDGLPLIAAARYLAAHAPTARAQRQTFEIARRLHRGERIYEDEPAA